MPSVSSCGRGMTWTETTSPALPAATAPASVAAFTAPTSPRTMTVTRPPPISRWPSTCTLAALTMASAASMAPTRPLVSISPSAPRIGTAPFVAAPVDAVAVVVMRVLQWSPPGLTPCGR